MRQYISTIAAACCLATVALLAACTANDGAGALRTSSTPATTAGANNSTMATPGASQTVATPADDVRRVTIPELQKMMASNEAVLVDVRDENAFKIGHITGSLSIPRGDLVTRMNELPKDKLIVFYCA